MQVIQLIIDAGIGLAGFAGIIVALSGNPRFWSSAEKIRVGIMLTSVLFTVFGAFLFVILREFMGEAAATEWASAIYSLCCVGIAVIALGRTVPVYRANDETFSAVVGISAIVITLLLATTVLVNCFVGFAPLFAMLTLLFVWGLLLGTVLFLRILFLRPGASEGE